MPTTVRCYGDFRQGNVYAERDCGTCIHLVACKDETTAKALKAAIAPAKAGAITAPSLLNKAASIMEERGKQYDSAGGERSMGRCVTAFNAITGRDLTEPEGWLLLQVLKDVRQWQKPGYHADSAEDCIAYAALKAEALARGSDDANS